MDDYDEPLSEVQELVWALLDEHISDADFRRLEQFLMESKEARQDYAKCVQMHVDLHQLFGGESNAEDADHQVSAPLPIVDLPLLPGEVPLPHGW